MSNYSRIIFARQTMAQKTDHLADNGQYSMVKQIRHEDPSTGDAPTTSQHPQNLSVQHPENLSVQRPQTLSLSPPQIYSPTSAPLRHRKLLKAPRVPPFAGTLAPTQQSDGAIVDADVHNTPGVSRPTPTQKFEHILDQDLEAKKKAVVQRKPSR